MPLKTFATRDEIPAEQRDTAIELKDGKFAIVEEEDRSSFDSALAEERSKREAAEKLAKKTADEIKKLQTKQKATETGLESEVIEKIKADAKAEALDELKADLEAGRAAIAENRTLKLDVQVKTMAGKYGVSGKEIEKWWKQHGDTFDLTSDGKPIVKGKEGVSLEKYIGEELKKETPYFYEGTKATGGGAGGVTTGGTSTSGLTAEDILANPSRAF